MNKNEFGLKLDDFLNDDFFNTSFFKNGNVDYNLLKNENEFILQLSLPGYNKENIKIVIDKYLKITGNREMITPDKFTVINRNILDRSFEKHFELDDDIDKDDVKAEFENGILSIHLKRKKNKQVKHVEIQ